MTRILAALAAAVLLTCAPVAAQLDTRTIPAASPLAGTERMPAVQGSGCVSKTPPCANVAVTPALIATFLTPAFQAKDADLDAIAALATTSFGRGLLTQADAAAVRSMLGLGSLATQSGTFSGTSSGSNSGDQTSVTGNAGTATKLSTARTINGVAFDGSAAITVNAVDATARLAAASNLADVVSPASARGNLGLGTIATQAAAGVAITGGAIDGLSRLGVATSGSSYALDVRGSGIIAQIANAGGGNYIQFGGVASGYAFVKAYEGAFAIRNDFGGPLLLGTNATDQIVIDASGATTPARDNAQPLGSTGARFSQAYAVALRPGTGAPIWTSGAGSPAGAVTAPVGSLYTRTDGGSATTLYVKESGTGSAGWVAK